jgi:pullulanase
MALHDLDTMADVAANLKTLNPYITVYGEPWTGGTTPLSSAKQASQANGNKYNGYGAFNDQMRDALIAGGMKGDGDGGWITYRKSSVSSYTMNRIKAGIQGFTFTDSTTISDPNKTVNYVTCHDNYTLYDRFTVYDSKHSDEEFTIDDLKQMSVLSNALVFTSQGTSFMLAGEEFLRSKQGDKNSYTSSYEVNELDYSLKIKYYDVFEKYQKLIEFKQSIDGLHLEALKASQIVVTCLEDNSAFYFTINDTLNGKTYMIAHANGLAGDNAKIDFSGYTLYYSTIRESVTLSSSTTILPFETIIGVKNS